MADTEDKRGAEAPRSFSWFLQQIGDGSLHQELTEELREMNAAMNQHVQDYRGVPKGKLTITLDFKLDKGAFEITGTFNSAKPKVPAAGAIMWSTADNNFTADHPKQLQMFPKRPVEVA